MYLEGTLLFHACYASVIYTYYVKFMFGLFGFVFCKHDVVVLGFLWNSCKCVGLVFVSE
jgi:hypothetical protein